MAWQDDFRKLISNVKEVTEGHTKLFSIDYEGGRVHRFPEGAPTFQYARHWVADSFSVGLGMSAFLKSIQLNLTYAPCLDVDLESTNPVIGERSFSSNPEIVSKAGLEIYKAFEQENIISCAKHFPGHGRTTIDSHFELPVLNISREELQIDLTPFISLIQAKIPLVMSSHIVFTSIDPLKPASLSSLVLNDLLKNDLGFDGLVCSDDFDMKALRAIPKKERYLDMLRAGTNLVVMGNGMDGKALEDAYEILSQLDLSNFDIINFTNRNQLILSELYSRYQLV